MFKCANCKKEITEGKYTGTHFRNHCPRCLWSKHFGQEKKSACKGNMKPIGLTFKQEGLDKSGKPKTGELMIIHVCQKCGELSINRLAADDSEQMILSLFEQSKELSQNWENKEIIPLGEKDEEEFKTQLFGKNHF